MARFHDTTTSSGIDHSGAALWIIFHCVGDPGRNFSKGSFIMRLQRRVAPPPRLPNIIHTIILNRLSSWDPPNVYH
jgi:hypothetical protein